ncbi:MAG: rhomboid family intramembrane serine protease [Bacteroidia bacterium]|nr:rhomboid family intramembrane serine protease [Bacteroidia bacterium]
MLIRNLPLEKKIFVHSLIFPLFFSIVLWIIKIIEILHGNNFSSLGILPRKLVGLAGIFTAPLIHGDFFHLFDNTFPLLMLSITVFYFYKKIAYQLFFLIYFISGFWVWLIAGSAYHIGASGLIYGLSAFILFSGIIRHDLRLLTIFLIVIIMYGGLIWGIFPVKENVSWESHLMGALSGMLLAVIFRKHGPPPVKYGWEMPEEEKDEDDDKEKSPDNNPARPDLQPGQTEL